MGVLPKGDVTPKAFIAKWATRGREAPKISNNEHSLDGEKITYQAQCPFHRQTSEHEPFVLH